MTMSWTVDEGKEQVVPLPRISQDHTLASSPHLTANLSVLPSRFHLPRLLP